VVVADEGIVFKQGGDGGLVKVGGYRYHSGRLLSTGRISEIKLLCLRGLASVKRRKQFAWR
jgi:hypothetical protein